MDNLLVLPDTEWVVTSFDGWSPPPAPLPPAADSPCIGGGFAPGDGVGGVVDDARVEAVWPPFVSEEAERDLYGICSTPQFETADCIPN